jgi:hypothetical protein
MRIPLVVRWPGVIKPGTVYNDIISHEDWMPTLLAAAGEPDVVAKLESKAGYKANGKTFRIHPDGFNFLPYFKGEVQKGPREQIMYFGQGGELNAVRWNDWKVNFAGIDGNIAFGTRKVTGWPLIVNLRADPYEKMPFESIRYVRWYGDNMWLFVPIQGQVKKFLMTILEYPFQEGSSLHPAGINYQTLKAAAALHVLPTLWFRNVWTWPSQASKPTLAQVEARKGNRMVTAVHAELGQRLREGRHQRLRSPRAKGRGEPGGHRHQGGGAPHGEGKRRRDGGSAPSPGG